MRSSILHNIFDHHYAGHLEDRPLDSIEWFPEGYQNGGDNYLVPPDILDATIPPTAGDLLRRVFLSISIDADWEVSEETWRAFSWNPRVVYVPSAEPKTNAAVYKRTLVPFTTNPKPTWAELLEWERNYRLTISLLPYRSAWTSLSAAGIPAVDLAKAREIHRDIIRRERAAAWREADAAWFMAMDSGDADAVSAAAAVRRRMRDAPANAGIGAASTIEALMQISLVSILAAAEGS